MVIHSPVMAHFIACHGQCFGESTLNVRRVFQYCIRALVRAVISLTCMQKECILEEHRREGFEVANANAIFESTNLKCV